jgi:ribosomal-protein-alanine acetyltransferase
VATADISIRPACPADIAALVLLEQASFDQPWSQASLSRDLTNNPLALYLVAENQTGEVVAYVGSHVVGDEAEIMNLAVAPAWRRRGVGRDLLRQLIAAVAARGVESLFLDVSTDNQAARALYGSLGFVPVGCRPGYYEQTRQSAIIMLKKISQ